jgi:hypothetical protein
MKFDFDKTKIVHQGIDTLVVSYTALNLDDYNSKYIPFCKELEELKEEAQNITGFDSSTRFVKSSLAGFGDFIVYAQGSGAYRYKIQNDDILVFLSTTKFGANDYNTAQIKVEFRSHYLFSLGHKKAFETVNLFISKILGETKKQLLRIDLATDIQGIKYTSLDKHRFQTNFKKTDYTQINEYTKHNKTTGFSIGGGDFLFRIYDKTLEIKQNPTKSFIVTKWIMNDFKQSENLTVFRHEVQFRREYLKKYTPKTDDEVTFHFNQLDKLWKLGTDKIEWVDLTNDEVIRICENGLKSNSIRSIFHRAKKDISRVQFWDIVKTWDNRLADQIARYEAVREAKVKTAQKYVKALVGATYKALGSNPQNLLDVVFGVQRDLKEYDNITLHQYGELKTLSNFVENAKIIEKLELNPINDFTYKAQDKYFALYEQLGSIDNPMLKSAKSYLEKRGLIAS